MTEKKIQIMQAATRLFSTRGFDATSTSSIASSAGVSEGLIFRHFGNKEGLLDAIIQAGTERASIAYRRILSIENPRYALKSILRLPFSISREDADFWRLFYSVRWQAGKYNKKYTEPLKETLVILFSRLNVSQPLAEAELALALIDGVASMILIDQGGEYENLAEVLLSKYTFEISK